MMEAFGISRNEAQVTYEIDDGVIYWSVPSEDAENLPGFLRQLETEAAQIFGGIGFTYDDLVTPTEIVGTVTVVVDVSDVSDPYTTTDDVVRALLDLDPIYIVNGEGTPNI